MDLSNFSIQRIATEFAYEPNTGFVDNRGAILEFGFSHWGYRQFKHDRVRFEDDEYNNKCEVNWKNTFFSMENVEDIDSYISQISKKLSKDFWRVMDIEDFKWVKIDAFLLLEKTGEIRERLNKSVVTPKGINNIMGGELQEVGFIFPFQNGDEKFYLNIFPLDKEQIRNISLDEDGLLLDEAIAFSYDYIIKKPTLRKRTVKSIVQEALCRIQKGVLLFEKMLYREVPKNDA